MKMQNADARLNRVNAEIAELMNKPFNGYLHEAMILGNKLVTCQRILNEELLVEPKGIKLHDIEKENRKLAAEQQ